MGYSAGTTIEKNIYPGGSSGSIMYTERIDHYISPQIVKKRYPNVAPFLTAVSNFETKSGLKGPQYKMFEHKSDWVRQYFRVTTGATTAADDGADAITITPTGAVGLPSTFNSSMLNYKLSIHANVDGKPGGVSKGVCVITVYTNATTVSVKNLTSAEFIIANGDWAEIIGTGFGEGSEAANPQTNEIKVVWNQCGIHKTAFQLTETIMEATLRGDTKEHDRLQLEYSQTHMIQKERDMLFSRSNIGTNLTTADTFGDGGVTDASGNALRSTSGAFASVLSLGDSDASSDDQNIFPINTADYDFNDLTDDAEKIFDESPDGTLPCFVGNRFLSFVNKVAGTTGGIGITGKSGWKVSFPTVNRRASRLGFNITEWETGHGIFQFVRTPSFTKSPYNGYAFAVDPRNIFHAVYRKPKYQQNIKTDNAPDYQKDQYMSDEGIGLTNLYNHNIMYLATG